MKQRTAPLLLRSYSPIPLMILLMVTGCATDQARTLGSLHYEPEPELETEATEASHEDVRAQYQELVDLVEDKQIREKIERRIGDIYMLEGDVEQLETGSGQSYYLEAIQSYREILERYPDSPNNAQLLYQLSRAYDMEGLQEEALATLRELTRRYPDYEHIPEANFRKADILFNLGDYEEAEQAYRLVSDHGNARFHLNARYMLAWSQYKQLRFREALDNYVDVLNQLLTPNTALDELSQPNQSLVKDTFHAVSLSLDKLGGATTIRDLPRLRDQHYVWRVYDDLGQYYLDKELYGASAEAYREFVKHHGEQAKAPQFHRKMIDTYTEGSFPRQAFEEKEQFVAAYGIHSDFAGKRGGLSVSVKPTLKEYLDELARNYHARGQDLQKEIQSLQSRDDAVPRPETVEERDTEAVAALEKAAGFYLQLLETFPSHEKRQELTFFRAEALFGARLYQQAIPVYEQVAYPPGDTTTDETNQKRRANAAYAAIVAHERHLDELEDDSQDSRRWRGKTVDSMDRFLTRYTEDSRSESVLEKASEHLFTLEQYQNALQIARTFLDRRPELGETAYSIAARALFSMERYDEASEAYLSQRELLEESDPEFEKVSNRLASAIYKHAEIFLAEDNHRRAVKELMRIKELSPDSPVRITAQYDAATSLLELEEWSRAITELEELSRSYPEHELAVEFPRKLAYAYEKSNDWILAADEYRRLGEQDPDPELRQAAVYRSASLYEKAEDYPAAIGQFKRYAHQYSEPFATYMEACYRLTENYQRIQDPEKRLYWLQKLVEGHGQAGDQQTERSRWLAAWANLEYADHHAAQFYRYNLYPPLGTSLPPKQKQLEAAAERYEMAADSGIFDFVTISAYKLGELYRALAEALRNSPRPQGLAPQEERLYGEIVEEHAQPFDKLAMEVHASNVERAWDGDFNYWIDRSFARMRELNPDRYAKTEVIVSYGDEIR